MFNVFSNKKFNNKKLLEFGFTQNSHRLIFEKNIFDNQFKVIIEVDKEGHATVKTIETETNELFTLHLVDCADGNFIGKLKEEYNEILEKIAAECTEPDVFKSKTTHEIIKYIDEKYNDNPEYLWEKFPNNAVFRRKDNAKWYAAILTVSKQKLGFDDNTQIEIIDLRTANSADVVDNKLIFPGYHMNKKSWITILLDGSAPIHFIKDKIDESYILAKKKK